LPSQADIRDLDVGDVDDMEASFDSCRLTVQTTVPTLSLAELVSQVDVPGPFLDYLKKVRTQKSKPKPDFNSKDTSHVKKSVGLV